MFLTPDEIVMALYSATPGDVSDQHIAGSISEQTVLRTRLLDSNPRPELVGLEQQTGQSHYLNGEDNSRWNTKVSHYSRVRYERVYPGIDMVFHDSGGQLEYDFVVAPGADPDQIQLVFEGISGLRVNTAGDLILSLVDGEVTQQAPILYQEDDTGHRQLITGAYHIDKNQVISFKVAAYDKTQPLIIDPVIVYTTFIGGAGADSGEAIATDLAGNIYISGSTSSVDFPAEDPTQPINAGNQDAFVMKLNPDGSELIYTTYLGGSGVDGVKGIAVDALGNVYLAGSTASTNFPTTTSAVQGNSGGTTDAFVAQLDSSGLNLLYSTYLGGSGSDEAYDIAVDQTGNIYITGSTLSNDFPTDNEMQSMLASPGWYDGFIVKLDTVVGLVYSTYLGGNRSDFPRRIVLDSYGAVIVSGTTDSTDFPTMTPLQPVNAGSQDAFIVKLDIWGTMTYSTYLGGTGTDHATGMAVDAAGNIYLVGSTYSTDFPVSNAFQASSANVSLYKSLDGGQSWNASGVAGAAVTTLAIRSDNPSLLYAGTSTRGMFKSISGGESWTQVNNGLTDLRINAIAFDPVSPDTLYAGTRGNGPGTTGSGLFKSTNGGATWIANGETVPMPYISIYALAFTPQPPFILYASGGTGIFPSALSGSIARSPDGGSSWTKAGMGASKHPVAIAIDPFNPLIMYAGVIDNESMQGAGVFKSLNGGTDWTRSSNGLPCGGSSCRYGNVHAIAIDPVNSATIYAGTPSGVYKSTDSGLNWILANSGISGSILDLDIHPSNPSILYAATGTSATVGNGLFMSTNGAASWIPLTTGLEDLSVANLAIDPVNPSTLYVGTSGSVGERDAFMVKLDRYGTTLVNSTYVGGRSDEQGKDIAVDDEGQVYLLGSTNSSDFPITQDALQPNYGGGDNDTFMLMFGPDLRELRYSSYHGGSDDDNTISGGMVLDEMGNVTVLGNTVSADLPTANAIQPVNAGQNDAFITRISFADPSEQPQTIIVTEAYPGVQAGTLVNPVVQESAPNVTEPKFRVGGGGAVQWHVLLFIMGLAVLRVARRYRVF